MSQDFTGLALNNDTRSGQAHCYIKRTLKKNSAQVDIQTELTIVGCSRQALVG